MLILFDHGTPRSIARFLHGHVVVEAVAKGWDRLSNGALLNAAEEAKFDLLLSTDKNIRYQQNLQGRGIAIVVLGNARRPDVLHSIDRVIAAVDAATPAATRKSKFPTIEEARCRSISSQRRRAQQAAIPLSLRPTSRLGDAQELKPLVTV